jgi:hypothetical protein
MLSATINQSTRLITDGIYKNEHFEVIDKKDREAIDMDTYNQQIYQLQLDQLQVNRDLIKKQVNDNKFDFKVKQEKIKERSLKEQKMQDAQAWDRLKDDWYWGSYSKDVSKSSYSDLDNYTNKLKDSAYEPIKISNEYKVIGNFIQDEQPTTSTIDKQFIYKSPFRDYIYDIKDDRLLPANLTNETPQPTIVEDENEKVNKAFNAKHNINATSSPTSTSSTEGFISNSNIDPKLIEIYQKTLPPNEYVNKDNVSYDVEYSYNYLYVLIIVIILFLLFKS